MLFESINSIEEVFSEVIHELHRGALDRKHPFRFVVLSSFAGSDLESRYVVLRKVGKNLSFFFYTDSRSSKVSQLNSEKRTSLLFFHPQKRVQIRVNGKAILHHLNDTSLEHWKNVQGEAQKAYNSTLSPGTEIKDPQEAFHWKEDLSNPVNFCVIEIQPDQIESLQLNGLEHLRIGFSLLEGEWQGKWLVP